MSIKFGEIAENRYILILVNLKFGKLAYDVIVLPSRSRIYLSIEKHLAALVEPFLAAYFSSVAISSGV